MSAVLTIAGRRVRIPWLLDPEEFKERERILRSQYFLVKISGNAGVGEVWRCKNCHGKHKYLSRNCVELPFNGLEEALTFYWQHTGEQFRKERANGLVDAISDLPDLATLHPEMTKTLATDAHTIDIGGMSAGIVEPIPKSLAQLYLNRINSGLPIDARVHIEGLETR